VIALCALIVAALACGSDNTSVKTGTSSSATATPAKAQVYAIGDVVQVKDHTIVLNSAAIQGGTLKANFTIENKGSADLAVSSMLSFSAKDTEGVKLDQEFGCGTDIGGKVLPGDKVKGDVCWKAAKAPVKIYYEANLFGSGAIVWEIK
jgi:NADH dehydrogenase FAD-containing subunit